MSLHAKLRRTINEKKKINKTRADVPVAETAATRDSLKPVPSLALDCKLAARRRTPFHVRIIVNERLVKEFLVTLVDTLINAFLECFLVHNDVAFRRRAKH